MHGSKRSLFTQLFERVAAHFFSLLLASCFSGLSQANNFTESTLEAYFDSAYVNQRQNHKVVGAVVSVVKDGKTIFKKGYGYADLENRVKADPDKHLFRIASISKPFTWTAVMQLVERDQLDTEVDIQQYLDFEFSDADPISLRNLMTHTPGFEEKGIGSVVRTPEEVRPLSAWLPQFQPAQVREPGTFMSYSNYGSAVAGYIVERVAGLPWGDYIQQEILNPLQMENTNVYQPMSDAHREAHAKGYVYRAGQFEATDHLYLTDTPAGVMSATAADMANFMIAHLNDGEFQGARILEAATAQTMRTELYRAHPRANPILHGFYRSDQNGIKIFGHGGDVNQFHSNMSLLPEHNLGIFVSFNSDPGAAARSKIIRAFVDHFFPVEMPAAIEPNANVNLEPYLGSWASTRRNYSSYEKLTLLMQTSQTNKSNDGGLVFGAGKGASRWYALEEDIFRSKYGPNELHFHRNKAEEVTHLTFSGGFGSFEKLSWWQDGKLHGLLFGLIGLGATLYLARFSQQFLFQRQSTFALFDRLLVIVFCSGSLLLLYRLYGGLTGDTNELVYGLPPAVEQAFVIALLLVPLAAVLVLRSIAHWQQGVASLSARLAYSLLSLGALLYVLLLWYWNLLSYFFK
ncbi:MAG: serine hydrolase domain-containing protein [Pseudomonadota bacterium]